MTVASDPRQQVPAPPTDAPGRSAAAAPLRVTSPVPRDIWREVLAADPDGLVTQSPEWVDALRAAGYADATRLYETPWGTRLLVPMVRRAAVRPRRLAPQASMPAAWGMGGVVSDAPLQPRDLEAVFGQLASERAVVTGIRPNPLHAELWAGTRPSGIVTIPRRAHVLDLAGGAQAVWDQRFRSTVRNRVRKAEKAGLDVECDTTGRLVPVFHGLLELSVERWARQQHEPLALARVRARRRDPLDKFRSMAAALGDAMRVWVAWKDGVPAASIIVLQGQNAHYTRGAMDKEVAGPAAASDLLEWLAIQDACAAGCRSYHFGESGWSRSLSQYKEKFGARPFEYAEYRLERLPLTRADAAARSLVKRVLGFRDA